METEGNSITFRLSPEMHNRLVRLAAESGVTKHKCARMLVVRSLEASDPTHLTQALMAIEDAVTGLRRALGRGIGAILQNVTDLEEDAIRKWVYSRLLSDASDEDRPPENPDNPNGERNTP